MTLETLSREVASYCKEYNELLKYKNSKDFDLEIYKQKTNDLLIKKNSIYDSYENLKK